MPSMTGMATLSKGNANKSFPTTNANATTNPVISSAVLIAVTFPISLLAKC